MQDLIDAAKKSPSTIRAATTGILSDDHLAILMTEEAAPGAIFRLVHLEGGAAQFKEIMAGNIDVAFDNVGSIVHAREVGRGARAGRDGRRALEVPARRADHEGARLSDRHLELDPRHRRTEGHAGADREQAARRAQEGDGGPRARQKLEDQGLAIKIMVGDEYAQYFADAHSKAKKYTEWAKNRPQKVAGILLTGRRGSASG